MKKFLCAIILVLVMVGGLTPSITLAIEDGEGEAAPFEDGVASVEDEVASFEDEATSFEDEVAFFEDEVASFGDEAASFEDEVAFFEDEAASFEDEIAFLEDEAASFEGMRSLNATVHNVATIQDLEKAIDTINNNSSHAQAQEIRITQNIQVPGSRVFSIRHPNVFLVAGAGHFRIQTTSSNLFLVQNNGGFTVSGGREGGSLELRGANNYDSAIVVNAGGWAEVTDGAGITKYPNSAVRVLNGGYFRLSGTARLYHNRSGLPNMGGGGVNVADGGVFEMFGGIIEWNTSARGGGVFVAGTFNMYGGEIRNNYATEDGGGLFVTSHNLDRITIAPTAVFSGNVAQNGKRIDNPLAERYRHQINPGTVSVTDMGDFLIDGESFAEIAPHAFTNYDINTEGPRFWRVTYAVREGQGSVLAKVVANDVLIPNGAFVPEGTEIVFVAEPALLLNRWDIGTRAVEADQDGFKIPFNFTSIEPDTPLLHTLTAHIEVIASFSEGVSITKHPNGGSGDILVRWLPRGMMHTLTHEPTHENEAMRFMGWNTEQNGQGRFFNTDEQIEVTEHITLYAQWRLPPVTLTLSKEVEGAMANRSMVFEFTLIFCDAEEELLPAGTQFHYFGGTLTNLGASAPTPTDGTLTLDETGSALLRLSHGQFICVEGILPGGYIQIIETPDMNYYPSFTDSESDSSPTHGNDTRTLSINTDRAIHFVNERVIVPPTGLNLGSTGAALLLFALTALPPSAAFILRTTFRFRKSQR